MSRRYNNILKEGKLLKASKENPEARAAAIAKGIDVSKRVRYVADGIEHYGVVRSMDERSVVVELSGMGMMTGGEDIIVREDTISFSGVLEVLGDGRLAQPNPVEKPPVAMAPRREKPYTTCDFDDSTIYEVLIVQKRGPVALCRDHAKGPTDDEPAPFRFRLGLTGESYRNWPKPTDDERAAWASKSSPSRGSSSNRSRDKSRPSGGRTRRRKARSR